MVKSGDILTINSEVIGIDGRIKFESGDKVVVRETWIEKAHYSKLSSDIWIPEKLKGVMLVDIYGIWKPSLFKELNNESIM